MRHKKITIDNKDIKYLIVEATGRIIESGEKEGENDTFEDTYVDLDSVKVGEPLKISYNKGVYSRRKQPKEPIWVELAYNTLEIVN